MGYPEDIRKFLHGRGKSSLVYEAAYFPQSIKLTIGYSFNRASASAFMFHFEYLVFPYCREHR